MSFQLAKMLRYMNYQTACDITFGLFIVTWFMARHVFYLTVCWSIYADVPTTMPYGCYDSVTGAKLTSSPSTSLSASEATLPANGGTSIIPHIMQSFQNPGGIVCFNPQIRYSFLALLLGLQVITLLWFGMILKVAWKVISGEGADDTRSDDEGDDEEEEVGHESETEKGIQKSMAASTGRSLAAVGSPGPVTGAPLEEEVGVEELHLGRRASPGVRVRRNGNTGRAAAMSTTRDRKELLGRIGCDGPS
jgi:very-long-chain ceramide synthase